MFKVYPVTETELKYDGYRIKINGEEVTPNVARVSAVPFNRRWPGHQRDVSQSELINFLSLETDEPLHFEITPKEGFERVVVRPESLGIQPEITADGKIIFTLQKPAYFTVEPYERRNVLHIFADPCSDYGAVDKTDENVLYFGRGEYEAGVIELKSNQTLFIDEGAVVYASVCARDAENIKICGRGILDNSHNKEEILFEVAAENNTSAVNNAIRRHTVQIEYCKQVTIEGITIRDSLVYNIRPIGCQGLNIENVKIIGCWRYNSDGIDMHNCIDVHINNCFIRTFDDSICVKGFDCYYEGDVEKAVYEAMHRNGVVYDTFKNVVVENCTVWNDWAKCLEIGAETRAEEICNIVFRNCNIIHVQGAPMDCYNIDYADVHNVVYENINIEYDDIIPAGKIQCNDTDVYKNDEPDYAPFLFEAVVEYHFEYSAGGTRRGKIRDITVRNIHLNAGRHTPKIRLVGYDSEHKTENISFSDIFVNGKRIENAEDIKFKIDNDVSNITFNGEKIYE